jgi:O-glycosyl hydrolase
MVNEVDIRSKSTLKLELFLFGHKLFVENNPKYHAFMYSLSQHLYSQQKFDIKWIKCLEKILNEKKLVFLIYGKRKLSKASSG